MNSGSDRQLSMEELRRRNIQKSPVEIQHPTAEEWAELAAALAAMGELLAEQVLLLEEISVKPRPWVTQEQTAELIREVKEVRRLAEQAGKKNERRFSLPAIRLPQPSLEWLLVPVVLLGRALERSDDPVPINDAAAVHRHTDSKTLRREREKKIALGHKEDDHEDTQTWQQTM